MSLLSCCYFVPQREMQLANMSLKLVGEVSLELSWLQLHCMEKLRKVKCVPHSSVARLLPHTIGTVTVNHLRDEV